MDPGITATLKAKYRRRLLFRVFDNNITGSKTVLNVELLTSKRWVKQERNYMHSEVIGNCWNHCFSMHVAEGSESVLIQIKDSVRAQLQEDAEAHGVIYTTVRIENLRNTLEE